MDDTLLGIQSKKFDDSIMFVLKETNNFDYPIVAIVRRNVQDGSYHLNKITSIYDKKNLQNYIDSSIELGKKIYINPKNKKEIEPQGLQLPSGYLFSCQVNTIYKEQIQVAELENQVIDSIQEFDVREHEFESVPREVFRKTDGLYLMDKYQIQTLR